MLQKKENNEQIYNYKKSKFDEIKDKFRRINKTQSRETITKIDNKRNKTTTKTEIVPLLEAKIGKYSRCLK